MVINNNIYNYSQPGFGCFKLPKPVKKAFEMPEKGFNAVMDFKDRILGKKVSKHSYQPVIRKVEPQQKPKIEDPVITPQKVEEPAVITPPKPKYEIPEAKFTCGEENPIQLAKEKDEYVTKLINRVSLSNDEDYALGAIKAFNEYGSKNHFEELGVKTNHLKRLGRSIGNMKSDKVLNAYLKTYLQHGKPSALDVTEVPTADSKTLHGLFDKYHDIMSKDSALLMIEGFKKTGCTYSDILKTGSFQKELYMGRFSPEDFKAIKTAAQDAIDTITKRGYVT